MTKITFRMRGRPDKSYETYGTTIVQKGRLSDNNCQGFNSNSKIASFFPRKVPQQNPNV